MSYLIVLWVLENFTSLICGFWPESKDDIKRSNISCHAFFETPILLAVTVHSRVKRCGFDGFLVEERYGLLTGRPKPEIVIATERGIVDVDKRIDKVIKYCADESCKESYSDWKKNKRYRRQNERART